MRRTHVCSTGVDLTVRAVTVQNCFVNVDNTARQRCVDRIAMWNLPTRHAKLNEDMIFLSVHNKYLQ